MPTHQILQRAASAATRTWLGQYSRQLAACGTPGPNRFPDSENPEEDESISDSKPRATPLAAEGVAWSNKGDALGGREGDAAAVSEVVGDPAGKMLGLLAQMAEYSDAAIADIPQSRLRLHASVLCGLWCAWVRVHNHGSLLISKLAKPPVKRGRSVLSAVYPRSRLALFLV